MAESLSDVLSGEDWDDFKRPAASTNTSKSSKGNPKKNQNTKKQEFMQMLDEMEDEEDNDEIEADVTGDELLNKNIMFWPEESQETNVSSITCPLTTKGRRHKIKTSTASSSTSNHPTSESNNDEDQKVVKVYLDKQGNPHTVMTLGTTNLKGASTYNKNYIKPKVCALCPKQARTMCAQCHQGYCYPLRSNQDGERTDPSRSCFAKHI